MKRQKLIHHSLHPIAYPTGAVGTSAGSGVDGISNNSFTSSFNS